MSKKTKLLLGLTVVIVVVSATLATYWATTRRMGIQPVRCDVYLGIEKNENGWVITVIDIIETRPSVPAIYHNISLPPKWVRYSLHGNSTLGNYTGVVALDPWHPLYVYNPGYIYNLIPGWEPHNITIADIKGKPSPLYNVTWNDVDNNDLFSSGDTFFISNTGGLIGKAETGFYFLLMTYATGIPNIYEGRNIIFLN